MEVYEFEKSFLDRMAEARNVLCWNDAVIPASQVRREWSSYVELQIEPIGWEALWKIPRVICEDLGLRFPTVVFGYVDQVLFKELKAVFVVTAVQDDDVHIPERNEVALMDLWATVKQENDALNVESTANCVDCLRFFYTHVWMPWDNESDNDRDWVEQHLEARIKLACDLNGRQVPRALAAHIRTLLAEARYLQQRLEYLELDYLSDGDDTDKENSLVQVSGEEEKLIRSVKKATDQSANKSNVSDLMQLHLRLAIIRSEIEILENPEMRQAYYEQMVLRKPTDEHVPWLGDKPNSKLCYLVMKPCVLQRQMELLQLAKQHVLEDCPVRLYPTLQDVLATCQSTDDILLAPGSHSLKFLEFLNDSGSIKGLLPKPNALLSTNEPLDINTQVVVTSIDDDSMLLVINGDFTLSQLVLDCRHVRTGILLKSGKLRVRNCRLIGDFRHSAKQAIFCNAGSELILEDCVLEWFATGITVQSGAKLVCSNINIKQCTTALELLDESARIEFEDKQCVIEQCKLGIYVAALNLPEADTKSLKLVRFDELTSYNASNWRGICQFKQCTRNIHVLNKRQQLCSTYTLQLMLDEHQLLADATEQAQQKLQKC